MCDMSHIPESPTKSYAAVGLASVLVFAACCLIAIPFDGDWAIDRDMMCELGVSESLSSCFLFFFGCVFGGSGVALYGYLMYTTAELTWPKVIYVTTTITGLALVCIGLFDMESSIHEVFTTTLAISSGTCLVASMIDDILRRRPWPCVLTAIVCASVVYMFFFQPNYVQPLTISLMVIWLSTRSIFIMTSVVKDD